MCYVHTATTTTINITCRKQTTNTTAALRTITTSTATSVSTKQQQSHQKRRRIFHKEWDNDSVHSLQALLRRCQWKGYRHVYPILTIKRPYSKILPKKSNIPYPFVADFESFLTPKTYVRHNNNYNDNNNDLTYLTCYCNIV